jgi:methylase of polypeptide subunit release factors
LAGQVDVLVFNPPYVPSEEDEIPKIHPDQSVVPATQDQHVGDAEFDASFAGGQGGTKVLERLLPHIQVLFLGFSLFYSECRRFYHPKEFFTSLLENSIHLRKLQQNSRNLGFLDPSFVNDTSVEKG